jgi:hypothetical protein
MKRIKGKVSSGARIAALAGLTAVLGLGMVQPAAAEDRYSSCSTGAKCWHYNSSGLGYNAEYGQSGDLYSANYTINGGIYYRFKAGNWGSAGANQIAWNNAGGARNRSSSKHMISCELTGYGGSCDIVFKGTAQTLAVSYNDNASMKWYP